jgi:excisionase family DNA binding protein
MADLVKAMWVAKFLAVSNATVYRWVERGEIPYVLLGDRIIRFDPDAIDAWVAARTQTITPAVDNIRRIAMPDVGKSA